MFHGKDRLYGFKWSGSLTVTWITPCHTSTLLYQTFQCSCAILPSTSRQSRWTHQHRVQFVWTINRDRPKTYFQKSLILPPHPIPPPRHPYVARVGRWRVLSSAKWRHTSACWEDATIADRIWRVSQREAASFWIERWVLAWDKRTYLLLRANCLESGARAKQLPPCFSVRLYRSTWFSLLLAGFRSITAYFYDLYFV